MTVYAVYCPDLHGYLGTYYYISDKPKLFWTRGAAENKATRYTKRFGEKCEVVPFELVGKGL